MTKDQRKAYNAQYRKNHPDYHAQWCKNNPEQVKAYNAQYRKDHPEYAAQYRKNNPEYDAQWCRDNPDSVAKNYVNRKFKLEQATPAWSETEEIKMVYLKRDEYRTLYGIKFEVDHIIPVRSDTVCGLHVLANLQLLDKSLNRSKHTYYQSDW